MRKLLAGCLALCIPALLTAQTPADSISRTEAIDSVVVTARRPLMVYKQTGNIAVDIEQLKYAPLFAGEKDIFKFLQLLPGVSAGKAYTANAFQMPTHELGQAARPDGPLYGIDASAPGKIVLFGGGFPYVVNGEVVGGIGVSGGTVEQDMDIAWYAMSL